jgi:hypothetical protein
MNASAGNNMTDIHTPESRLRIRLKRTPPAGEFDGFELGHFRVGQTYVVGARLASLLILAGCAEMADSLPQRTEAADYSRPAKPRRRK